jgi:tetratricopeptide (TPR) repeat protein
MQVEGGQGQVVGLVGEPGVGKSRLLYEFRQQVEATVEAASPGDRVRYLEGHCLAYGSAFPYLPVLDLLRAQCRIGDTDSAESIAEKVGLTLHTVGMDAEEGMPYLLRLLGLPPGTDQLARLQPEMVKARTFATLRQLSLHSSQHHPLVLAIENLQWIDQTSQDFLASLVEHLAGARILLLLTYRPEYQHGWGSKTYYAQLRLDPLPPASAGAFLAALLGDDASLAPLTRFLIARTEGNPFFLEESVRTMVEMGVLVGTPGAYRLGQPLPGMPVPATVQAVLAARIDRLLLEDKRLLQTAAVIGTDVPLSLLQAIADVPEAALHRGLAHLQAAEFLYETRLFPEPEYTFKHALTHEVAYGSLLLERRRGLHACLVEALEAFAPDRVAEQVERLAHHALRGEVWDKAVTYCRQAGARAHDRAAFREAVASFDQALQALAHLPEPGDTGGLAIELRLALGGALGLLGEYQRRLALLGEAEALARACNDRARLGRVLDSRAEVLRLTEDYEGAMAAARQALALAAALGDSALQGQASSHLGQVYYALGDFGRATELLWQSMEAANRESGTPSTQVRIVSQAWLARALSPLGAFAEGRRHGEEALRLATLDGRGVTPIVAHACLGHLYLAQGDLEHAIRVLEQGLALCRASGTRSGWLPTIMACLGSAYALHGRLAEGRVLLEEANSESIRARQNPNWVAQLSEVCRLAGRGEEAWQNAHQALDLARQLKERGSEARALHQLGVVQAHADPPDVVPAETHYQQALALAEALGMRPLVAHCHLGLGTLYLKTGRREQARSELAAAIELYRAMAMTFWLPQAEAGLAQVEGRR